MPVLGSSGKDTIVARGPWRLYHYHPLVEEVYRVPILLVMATTNRGYIFDMAPGTSLVEFLLLQGYDVFMVDWEAPRPEDRQLGLKEYVQDFVGGSIAEVRRLTGEHDVSLLGYCMGGVLSVMWSGLNHADGPHNLVVFTTGIIPLAQVAGAGSGFLFNYGYNALKTFARSKQTSARGGMA